MPSVNVMTDRPEIYDTDPLIEQLKDLDFYLNWINRATFQPSKSDWDYYRAHLNRLKPLEDAWRSRRYENMILQARPFLEYVTPAHKQLADFHPEISEELFNLLSIYDAACQFYVYKEFDTWQNSQASAVEARIRQFIRSQY